MVQINRKLISNYVIFTASIGIVACIADCFIVYYLGKSFPGYHPLRQPMSILGSATSPFAHQISLWWIIQGVMIVFYAIGFIIAFWDYGRIARFAGLLIIVYGLGEGVATGAIPVEVINGHLTFQGYVHDLLGGIGVAAVMVLPFVMQRFFAVEKQKILFRFSLIIGISGIFFFGMFSVAKILNTPQGIFSCGGAWQRLSSMNYYLYFIVLSILMYRKVIKSANS